MKNRSKGIALSYVNTVISIVSGIILSSFYIRQLGKTEYGVYEAIGSFINYLVLFEFGTGTVITRNLSLCFARGADDKEIKKHISTVWSITLFLSFFITLVATVFYLFIGRIYSLSMTASQIACAKNIFIFLFFYLIISFLSQTLSGIVLAYENYTFSSKMAIIRGISKFILVILLILLVKKAIIIAIVDTAISLILFLYTYYFCKKNYSIKLTVKYFDKQILKSSLPLCMAIFLQAIVNQANSNVDKFVISVMISPESVAVYSIALFIYSMFSTATTIPISLFGPKIIKDVEKGKHGRELADTLIQPSRLIVIIGGLILFGFISSGRQFIYLLYGKGYFKAYVAAILIMIPMFVNMSNGVVINVLDALNKRMVRSVALFITTLANICLTVFAVRYYGIVGAAAATLICTFAGQVVTMNYYYLKKLKLPVFYMFYKTYKGIVPYQIIAMAVSLPFSKLISDNLISFLVCGFIFVGVFAACFVLFGKNRYEKEIIDNTLIKLRLKRNV